jgi:hypothetical protein
MIGSYPLTRAQRVKHLSSRAVRFVDLCSTGLRASLPSVFPHSLSLLTCKIQALVTIETVRILREDVTTCYRREGVNYIETCKPLVKQYLSALNAARNENARNGRSSASSTVLMPVLIPLLHQISPPLRCLLRPLSFGWYAGVGRPRVHVVDGWQQWSVPSTVPIPFALCCRCSSVCS